MSANARLACAAGLATTQGFAGTGSTFMRSLLVDGRATTERLVVGATDSSLTVDVQSTPSGTMPSSDARRVADHIRRSCGA
jgi:hypothetical protein